MNSANLRPTAIATDRSPCYLSRLPPELRLLIYEHVFQDAHLIFDVYEDQWPDLSGPGLYRRNLHVSILRTCKMAYVEASPVLWSRLHLCIEAETFVKYRYEGIWGAGPLANMASHRQRLENVVIGFAVPTRYRRRPKYPQLHSMVTVLSIFASDFQHYASLKTCTLAQFSSASLLGPCPYRERREKILQLQSDADERNDEPPWCMQNFQKHDGWQDGLGLLFNRRFDPYNQRFLTNEHGRVEYDPGTSMRFEISLLACIDFKMPRGVDHDRVVRKPKVWDQVGPRLVWRSKVTGLDNFNIHLDDWKMLSAEWNQSLAPGSKAGREVDETVLSPYQAVVSCLSASLRP